MRNIKFIAFALVFALFDVGWAATSTPPPTTTTTTTTATTTASSSAAATTKTTAPSSAAMSESGEVGTGSAVAAVEYAKTPAQIISEVYNLCSERQMNTFQGNIYGDEGLLIKIKELNKYYTDSHNKLTKDDKAKCLMSLYWLTQALCKLTIDKNLIVEDGEVTRFKVTLVESTTSPAASVDIEGTKPPAEAQSDISNFVDYATKYTEVLSTVNTYLNAVANINNLATAGDDVKDKFSDLKNECAEISLANLFPAKCEFPFRGDTLSALDLSPQTKYNVVLKKNGKNLPAKTKDWLVEEEKLLKRLSMALNKNTFKDEVTDDLISRFNIALNKIARVLPESSRFKRYKFEFPAPEKGDVAPEYLPSVSDPSIAKFKRIKSSADEMREADATEVYKIIEKTSKFDSDDLYMNKAMLMKFYRFVQTYGIIKNRGADLQKNTCEILSNLANKYLELVKQNLESTNDSNDLFECGLTLINAIQAVRLIYDVDAILKNWAPDVKDITIEIGPVVELNKKIFKPGGYLDKFKEKFNPESSALKLKKEALELKKKISELHTAGVAVHEEDKKEKERLDALQKKYKKKLKKEQDKNLAVVQLKKDFYECFVQSIESLPKIPNSAVIEAVYAVCKSAYVETPHTVNINGEMKTFQGAEKKADERFPGSKFVATIRAETDKISALRAKIKELQMIGRAAGSRSARHVNEGDVKRLLCVYWLSQALCNLVIERKIGEREGEADVAHEVEEYKNADIVEYCEFYFSHINKLDAVATYLEAAAAVADIKNIKGASGNEADLFSKIFVEVLIESSNISLENLFPKSEPKIKLETSGKPFEWNINYLQELLGRENRLIKSMRDVFQKNQDEQISRIRKSFVKIYAVPSEFEKLQQEAAARFENVKPQNAYIKSEIPKLEPREPFDLAVNNLKFKETYPREFITAAPDMFPATGNAVFTKDNPWWEKNYPHTSAAYKGKINWTEAAYKGKISKTDAVEVWKYINISATFKVPNDLYSLKTLLLKYYRFVQAYRFNPNNTSAVVPTLYNQLHQLILKYYETSEQFVNPERLEHEKNGYKYGLELIDYMDSICLVYEFYAISFYSINLVPKDKQNDQNRIFVALQGFNVEMKNLYETIVSIHDADLKIFNEKFKDSNDKLMETCGQSELIKKLLQDIYICYRKAIVQARKDIFNQKSYVKESLKGEAETLRAKFKAGWQKIADSQAVERVKGFARKIGGVVSPVTNKIAEFGGGAWNKVKPLGDEAWRKILPKLQALSEKIKPRLAVEGGGGGAAVAAAAAVEAPAEQESEQEKAVKEKVLSKCVERESAFKAALSANRSLDANQAAALRNAVKVEPLFVYDFFESTPEAKFDTMANMNQAVRFPENLEAQKPNLIKNLAERRLGVAPATSKRKLTDEEEAEFGPELKKLEDLVRLEKLSILTAEEKAKLGPEVVAAIESEKRLTLEQEKELEDL